MTTVHPITLEALQVLDAIDRRGSFARAAEELGKATSALSYSVQKLEEQLDITLFQRQGRRSVLTPAGRLLLERGREILTATSQLADRVRELANGWEPRLLIAIESVMDYDWIFARLEQFLQRHPGIELDIGECVLGGGWDALESGRVDLVIGAPGPVPQQKGFRAVSLGSAGMTPVVAARHPLARVAHEPEVLQRSLTRVRRVITHDTTSQGATNVARSAGLSDSGQHLYVQTMEQKFIAICQGLGPGHLPRHRIQPLLDSGQLVELQLANIDADQNLNYLAWRLSHKGKGLQALTALLLENTNSG